MRERARKKREKNAKYRVDLTLVKISQVRNYFYLSKIFQELCKYLYVNYRTLCAFFAALFENCY